MKQRSYIDETSSSCTICNLITRRDTTTKSKKAPLNDIPGAGESLQSWLGEVVGFLLGERVGSKSGRLVGRLVGFLTGLLLGLLVGFLLGLLVDGLYHQQKQMVRIYIDE